MGRPVRIVQIPLSGVHGKFFEAALTNPRISHWALLFGNVGAADSFLIEMFPKSGKTKLEPLTYIVHSCPANLEGRHHKFKLGFFSQPDSPRSDEQIIEAAQEIIAQNPIYCLWPGYNCQNFVNDLVEKLRGESAVAKFFRKWTPFGSLLWRGPGGPPEIEAGSEEEHKQALGELELLMEVGELWAAEKDATVWAPENVPDQPEKEGHLSMFRIRDQPYTEAEPEDDLEDIGVVYAGQAKNELAIEMSGITENPRYLDDEKATDLSIAEALVGEVVVAAEDQK